MDPGNVEPNIPALIQVYANVVVAIGVAGAGLYGFYRKMSGGLPIIPSSPGQIPAGTAAGPFQAYIDLLKEIAATLRAIHDMARERLHQDEIDRAYQKGRDRAQDEHRS